MAPAFSATFPAVSAKGKAMNDTEPRRNPVEILAEEFVERYRRGERPTVTEYVGEHPELSAEIREVFPALLAIEEAGARLGGARVLTTPDDARQRLAPGQAGRFPDQGRDRPRRHGCGV